MPKALTAQPNTAQQTRQRREPVGGELREAIIVGYVEGKTQAEIAEDVGRSPHTIRTVLRSDYGRQRQEELLNEVKHAAVTRLRRNAVRAVDSWIRQMELADEGKRANHLPARGLLTHAGVLDVPSPKKDDKPQVTIHVGGSDIEPVVIDAETIDDADSVAVLPAAVLPDDDSNS